VPLHQQQPAVVNVNVTNYGTLVVQCGTNTVNAENVVPNYDEINQETEEEEYEVQVQKEVPTESVGEHSDQAKSNPVPDPPASKDICYPNNGEGINFNASGIQHGSYLPSQQPESFKMHTNDIQSSPVSQQFYHQFIEQSESSKAHIAGYQCPPMQHFHSSTPKQPVDHCSRVPHGSQSNEEHKLYVEPVETSPRQPGQYRHQQSSSPPSDGMYRGSNGNESSLHALGIELRKNRQLCELNYGGDDETHLKAVYDENSQSEASVGQGALSQNQATGGNLNDEQVENGPMTNVDLDLRSDA